MRSLALAALLTSIAHAHGGLPYSTSVMHSTDGTLYVPVVFWGIWVQHPGGPWRWICEEAINNNRFRKLALATDGATFYTTDLATDTRSGLQVSPDRGCTWNSVPMFVSRLVNDVAADPVDPKTGYLVTGESPDPNSDAAGTGDNALYLTHDRGMTWTPAPGLMASPLLLKSVKLAPSDAKTIYVASIDSAAPYQPAVHRSTDGGMTFTVSPVTFTLDGNIPHAIDLLAIDPRDTKVVYVRVFLNSIDDAGNENSRMALLRSTDGGATFNGLLTIDGIVSGSGYTRGIDGVAIDASRGKVWVATVNGLFVGDDPGSAASVTLSPMGGLSQAQCIDAQNGSLLACSTDYAPDFKALARSDDGGNSFMSILAYVDTDGTTDCPAGTPVGDQCPNYWALYGSQLGIAVDGGASDGGSMGPGAKSCGCSVSGDSAGFLAALVGLAVITAGLRRRRRA